MYFATSKHTDVLPHLATDKGTWVGRQCARAIKLLASRAVERIRPRAAQVGVTACRLHGAKHRWANQVGRINMFERAMSARLDMETVCCTGNAAPADADATACPANTVLALPQPATHQAALVISQITAVAAGGVVDAASRAGEWLRARLAGVGVTTCAGNRLQQQANRQAHRHDVGRHILLLP
jgi:hypothetical protein